MKAGRKASRDAATTTRLLLDATERLMLEEGYAAVSTRRVAKLAGFTSALVHYYFPTTDDLLIALYRRTTEAHRGRLANALASERPLHAMWDLYSDPGSAAIALEFIAMANHRKAIKAEITQFVEETRRLQAETLAGLAGHANVDPAICPPACLSVLFTGLWRVLIMEEGTGISAGHAETRAFVHWLLDRLEPA